MASAQSIIVRSTLKSVHPPCGFYCLVGWHYSHTTWNGTFNGLFCAHFTIFDCASSTSHPPVAPSPHITLSHRMHHWSPPSHCNVSPLRRSLRHSACNRRTRKKRGRGGRRPSTPVGWGRLTKAKMRSHSKQYCILHLCQSISVNVQLSHGHYHHRTPLILSLPHPVMLHASGGDHKLLSIMCVHSVLRNFYMMIVWIHIKYQQLILASKEIVSILLCSKNCATKQHSMQVEDAISMTIV